MAGLLLALLALVVGHATAIEPWTLGDLGGSGVASKIYDDLDTDVSIASRPEHSVRSNLQKPEQALPHWEAADLTRRFREEEEISSSRRCARPRDVLVSRICCWKIWIRVSALATTSTSLYAAGLRSMWPSLMIGRRGLSSQ